MPIKIVGIPYNLVSLKTSPNDSHKDGKKCKLAFLKYISGFDEYPRNFIFSFKFK
jgi:hypothetical protein